MGIKRHFLITSSREAFQAWLLANKVKDKMLLKLSMLLLVVILKILNPLLEEIDFTQFTILLSKLVYQLFVLAALTFPLYVNPS